MEINLNLFIILILTLVQLVTILTKKEDNKKTNTKSVKNIVEIKSAEVFYDLTESGKYKDFQQLVYFFTPKCQACQEFNPVYEKLASVCGTGNYTHLNKIRFYKMNGAKNDDVVNIMNIENFPAIYFIDRVINKTIIYEGARTEEAVINFLNKRSNFTIEEVVSLQHFEEVKQSSGKHLLIVGDKTKNEEIFSLVNKIGRKNDLFVYTSNAPEFRTKYLTDADSSKNQVELVLFRILRKGNKFDEGEPLLFQNFLKNFTMGGSNKKLDQFLGHMTKTPVLALSEDDFSHVIDEKETTLIFLYKSKNDSQGMVDVANKAAKHFRFDNIWILHGSSKFKEFEVISDVFNLHASDLPGLVLIARNDKNQDDLQKFVYRKANKNDKITLENVIDFVGKFKNGELEKFKYSDPISMSIFNKETNVRQVVGSNFESFLTTQGKDVFMMVCINSKRCNNAKNIMIRVAKKLKNISSILFGIIDPSTNEISNIAYKHLPSFLISPDGEDRINKIKIFNGKRGKTKNKPNGPKDITTKNLIAFIKEKAKHPINDSDLIALENEVALLETEMKTPLYYKAKRDEEEKIIVKEGHVLLGGGLKRTFKRHHEKTDDEDDDSEDEALENTELADDQNEGGAKKDEDHQEIPSPKDFVSASTEDQEHESHEAKEKDEEKEEESKSKYEEPDDTKYLDLNVEEAEHNPDLADDTQQKGEPLETDLDEDDTEPEEVRKIREEHQNVGKHYKEKEAEHEDL